MDTLTNLRPELAAEAAFVKQLGPWMISSPLLWCLFLMLLAFAVAMLWAPRLIGPLIRFTRDKIDKEKRPILFEMHGGKQGTPTAGGLLFYITTIVLTFVFLWPISATIGVLIAGMAALGLVGLVDDILVTWGRKFTGLAVWHKLTLQIVIATFCAMWIFSNIGMDSIHIPFTGEWQLGALIIPLIVFTIIATSNAVNFTDGLDGLAGGLSIIALLAYLAVALHQGQWDVAVFVSLLIGSGLTYLWFNIYPARFIMGDIGAFALGIVIALLAVLTDTMFLLPVIGGVFVLEAISVILQIWWRKFYRKKLFLIAPFHYHFERLGWPETKVTMRFWVVGILFSLLGLMIYFADFYVIRS